MTEGGAATDEAAAADAEQRSDIVDALGRVLSSPSFARSDRSRAFLAYVVSETLAGRGDRISERTVGRGALGRGPAFEGVSDSSVRVNATRVRQALERYYDGEGASDPVRIVLPPGRYTPDFEHVPAGTASSGALVPGVAVLTPHDAGDESAKMLAALTADALVARLSEYGTLTVVGPTSARDDVGETGRRVGVSHVLDGSVVGQAGSYRLVAHLVSSMDGAVVWSQTYDDAADDDGDLGVHDQWAAAVAAYVADHGGLVLAHAVRHGASAEAAGPEHRAQLAYFAYIDRTTQESIRSAIAALDEALAAGVRSAAIFAMRGAVANAAVLQGIGEPAADTDLAEQMAREALLLDPGNAHAYLVLGGAARARGRWTQCREYAEKAARLAPWQPVHVLSAGLLLASAGDWPAGLELVERGLRLNPRLPVHAHLWLALGNVVLGHYDRALAEATLLDVDGEVFGPLYRALSLSGLGLVEDARREVERLVAIDPEFLDGIASRFTAALNLTDEQVERIVALLDAARPAA